MSLEDMMASLLTISQEAKIEHFEEDRLSSRIESVDDSHCERLHHSLQRGFRWSPPRTVWNPKLRLEIGETVEGPNLSFDEMDGSFFRLARARLGTSPPRRKPRCPEDSTILRLQPAVVLPWRERMCEEAPRVPVVRDTERLARCLSRFEEAMNSSEGRPHVRATRSPPKSKSRRRRKH